MYYSYRLGNLPQTVRFEPRPGATVPSEFLLYGGAVRDQLLGQAPSDFDYVYCNDKDDANTAYTIMQALLGQAGWRLVAANAAYHSLKAVHNETGAVADFTHYAGPIACWLLSRDLTINSIALSNDLELIDVRNRGSFDLELGRLRSHVKPLDMLASDPIRVLRVLRFKLRYGYKFDEKLAEAFYSHGGKLAELLESEAPERRRAETVKLLKAAEPHKVLLELGKLEHALSYAVLNPPVPGKALRLTLG